MASLSIKLKSLWHRLVKRTLGILDPQFLGDMTVRILGSVSLVILALIWIYAIFRFTPTDYLVPLRYNSFLGVTALGSWYQLYAVPVILILVFLANGFLASAAYAKDKLVSYILLGTNIFVAVCGATVVISLSVILSR